MNTYNFNVKEAVLLVLESPNSNRKVVILGQDLL